ncbi:MAG: carboxypeptidase-like regulatory domain-containing protein [Cyanobacteria bacterium P01_D01_bin.123]
MSVRSFSLIFFTYLTVALGQGPVFAHGANVQYRATRAIAIRAAFDSGEPMAEAQVTVFAPDNSAEPWLQGKTDAAGQFSFVPDSSQAGSWEVQVRQAGHGDIVSIPAEAISAFSTSAAEPSALASARSAGSVSPPSPAQIALTAAAGVWGCIGTACFFVRKGG